MNGIPIVGWLISAVCTISFAVPFWICWTYCGLGEFYFGEYIPARFHAIPFWNIVGLFTIINILKGGVPNIASVSQSVAKDK